MTDDVRDDRQWELGWEGHADAQLRRLARLPLIDKLAWLEEAQRVVDHLAQAPRRREPADRGD